ncbi:TetR/AcrR family transcriptional regulator [Mycobacterium spongiae]|uniref:TetR family transcriptional regulator n=1 Tax=Mycobacterium spongiae TaxID=886343 RepID=A0A975PYN8_9MYCO|nr:TetR/AcrR family transcriptional regulator [Mycobacterium spongiae]QUR69445.1 TetR family transcriptional regulator [Mycobacterium spongiae]
MSRSSAHHLPTALRLGPPKQLGRPPGSSAEQTVSRLLEAALADFAEAGYSGARMTRIATAASITHSSIYRYFSSKRQLYQATFGAALSTLLPDVTQAITTDGLLREKLGLFLRALAGAYQNNRATARFLAAVPLELSRQPDLLPAEQEGTELLAAMVDMFATARLRGEISAEINDLDLVVAFLGSAVGIAVLSQGLPGSNVEAATNILVAAVEGSLFTK